MPTHFVALKQHITQFLLAAAQKIGKMKLKVLRIAQVTVFMNVCNIFFIHENPTQGTV